MQARYGVDPTIVTAIWGLESFYGERRGAVPVVSATSTLAYEGRRGAFFEEQLLAALRILQNGDTTPERMTGSWAGAMGHTQFIPTSYLAYAVDFTGDGRRDIWSDDPSDSLASTAAYLARSGWTPGQRWGGMVATAPPPAPPSSPSPAARPSPSPATSAPSSATTTPTSTRSASASSPTASPAPGPLPATFPPDANGLTKDDRIALQRGLTARGSTPAAPTASSARSPAPRSAPTRRASASPRPAYPPRPPAQPRLTPR